MSCDDNFYLFDLVPFLHEPLRPPRDGCVGEAVFAERWKRLMALQLEENSPHSARLAVILSHMAEPLSQRHATVAASFVTWLGTNIGLSFVREAQRLVEQLPHDPEKAWLAQWTWHNRRLSWMNNGIRSIEYILAPLETFTRDFLSSLSRLPDLSASDYETVEGIVIWLSTREGSHFLSGCERAIERRLAELRDELAQEVHQ